MAGVNDAPASTPFTTSGFAGSDIPVSLSATDIDGSITSITVTAPPAAHQGTLLLANGTPVITGQVLTPAQAAGLLFRPNPGFNGFASFAFKATDNQGAESPTAAATVNVRPQPAPLLPAAIDPRPVTVINPTTVFTAPSEIFNKPAGPSFNLPVIPLSIEHSLFVQFAVRESQNAISQAGGVNAFITDSVTVSELNNFTADLRGLPSDGNNSLFIQNVIHGLPILSDPSLFVHKAVIQSQLESTLRSIGIAGAGNSNLPLANLMNEFDIGAIAIENAALTQSRLAAEAGKEMPTNDPKALPAFGFANTIEGLAKATTLDIPHFDAPLTEASLVATRQPQAAASFLAQIGAAAKNLKQARIQF